MISQTIL